MIYSINNSSNNNIVCSICSKDFNALDSIQTLKCKHIFHRECIEEGKDCPNCNTINSTPRVISAYESQLLTTEKILNKLAELLEKMFQ